MTILWMDGFDGMRNRNDIITCEHMDFTSPEGPTYPQIYTGADRTSDYSSACLHVEQQSVVSFLFDGSSDEVYSYFHFNYGGGDQILRYYDNADVELFKFRATGSTLTLTNGDGTTLDTIPLGQNQDHKIEMYVKFHPTLGVVNVFINKVPVITLNNVNTTNTSSGDDTANRVSVYGASSGGFWDDVAFSDTEYLGELAIVNLAPTSDNSVQFTPSSGAVNYANVNQVNSSTDTLFNSSGNPGDTDLFNFEDLAATGDPILAVQARTRTLDQRLTPIAVKLHVNTGAHTVESPARSTESSSFLKLSQIIEYQDDISVAWTESAVNAIVAGVEVA